MTFKFARAIALVLFILPVAAHAAGHATEGGVVTIKSAHSVSETIDRLAAAVEGAGAKVFARVDHAAGAESVGEALRPTEMLMFGNPKMGTPAMQASQTMGMDLPLRAVAWEDETGVVHLSYTDPAAIADRHGIPADHPAIAAMTGALGKLTGKATGE
ncbi:MAG: DUF302 domain-containing protein [Pseudomonadota bacterium]